MQYLPKRKFFVTLSDVGPITVGAAVAGFIDDPMNSANLYDRYVCLLENPANDDWELISYNPNATNAAGFRTILSSSNNGNSVLPSNVPGLSCTLVAHPNSYVLDSSVTNAPIVSSSNSLSVGGSSDIGTGSANSISVKGTVRDDSPRSVCIGGWAGGGDTVAVGFEASAENVSDSNTYDTINCGNSVAIGYRAVTTAGGEVALGSANASHMSGIPLMTDNPAAGGTFLFKSVAGYNSGTNAYVLADLLSTTDQTYIPPNTSASPDWVIHVQGIIVARADDAANDKVVKVEWVTGGALTQTVLTQGVNNISLGLALNGMRLEATVGAVAGLKLAGYIHVTKIALKNYP